MSDNSAAAEAAVYESYLSGERVEVGQASPLITAIFEQRERDAQWCEETLLSITKRNAHDEGYTEGYQAGWDAALAKQAQLLRQILHPHLSSYE